MKRDIKAVIRIRFSGRPDSGKLERVKQLIMSSAVSRKTSQKNEKTD